MRNLLSKIFILLVGALIFSACGQENLYESLTEKDANEILVLLNKNGIEASKTRVEGSQETTFTVGVSSDDVNQARALLVENNLPRVKELGFAGICKDTSIIPTPEQEKCRKLLGLKGEIINALEQRVPGIIDADVVLNIPEVSEFADEDTPPKKPTASAVLQVKKELTGYQIRESSMQRFISNSVENLDPRDVAVIISYVEDSSTKTSEKGAVGGSETAPGGSAAGSLATIAGLQMNADSLKRFKIYAVAILLVLIGVSVALIMNVIRLTRMRQELKVSRAQGGAEGVATPLLKGGANPEVAQLKSGEEEKVPSPPQST